MAEYDNSNTWALWKEDLSDKSDRHPVLKGRIELGDDILEALKNGERTFYLSAWKGSGEGNSPALRGQIQPPFKGEKTQQPVAAGANDSFDF